MNQDFTYLLRVRYLECDAQKVVFNGRYADYVDIALGEYMRALWGDYANIIEQGVDFQVVSLTINWKAPAQFDHILAVQVRSGRIGNTSFTAQCDFYNYKTKQPVASAEITYVMVSATEFTKMPIPDDMRAKIEKGAPGVVVDHAGANVGQASN